MGNICCGDTSTDNSKTNGKIQSSQLDEENSLQGSNQEPLELQHISEREYGLSPIFLSHVINLLSNKTVMRYFLFILFILVFHTIFTVQITWEFIASPLDNINN